MKSEPNVDPKPRIKNSPRVYCTWQELEVLVEKLADKIQRSCKKYDMLF